MTPVLEVGRLCVRLPTPDGPATVVDGIDYRVEVGEVFGIAGESGSGKSVTGLALTRLLPEPPAIYRSGEILLEGHDVLKMKPPMCITRESADFFVDMFDRVLRTGW